MTKIKNMPYPSHHIFSHFDSHFSAKKKIKYRSQNIDLILKCLIIFPTLTVFDKMIRSPCEITTKYKIYDECSSEFYFRRIFFGKCFLFSDIAKLSVHDYSIQSGHFGNWFQCLSLNFLFSVKNQDFISQIWFEFRKNYLKSIIILFVWTICLTSFSAHLEKKNLFFFFSISKTNTKMVTVRKLVQLLAQSTFVLNESEGNSNHNGHIAVPLHLNHKSVEYNLWWLNGFLSLVRAENTMAACAYCFFFFFFND